MNGFNCYMALMYFGDFFHMAKAYACTFIFISSVKALEHLKYALEVFLFYTYSIVFEGWTEILGVFRNVPVPISCHSALQNMVKDFMMLLKHFRKFNLGIIINI